jgi:hypothetical protein
MTSAFARHSCSSFIDGSSDLLLLSADYAGMMRGLYPGGQGGGGGRSYPHHGMSSYHQHNLHRYNQVGKYIPFLSSIMVKL